MPVFATNRAKIDHKQPQTKTEAKPEIKPNDFEQTETPAKNIMQSMV